MDDVVSIELIDQLPQMTRTLGGAAETFLEGDFSSERYGTLKVCLVERFINNESHDPSCGITGRTRRGEEGVSHGCDHHMPGARRG